MNWMRSGLRARTLHQVAGVFLVFGIAAPAVHAQPNRNAGPSSRSTLALYRQKYEELHQKLVGSLDELARHCHEKGFHEAAGEIRRLAAPVDPQVLRIEALPGTVQADIPSDLPPDERYWRRQLHHIRQEHAKQLYLLSRRALYAGLVSLAYQLVHEVAYHDSDHASARRILGQVRYGDEWVTPFAAEMLRRRYEWHDKFGWLPASHIKRYEQGDRFFKGRWISAAQEMELRRDFRNAWEIRTEHYLIRTNHSLERGVEIADALERFHDFFHHAFAGFFNTPEQLQKLFAGRQSRASTRNGRLPHEVHYFRTREEYNRRLRQKIPQIEITNGLYYTTDRVAYFYHDPDEANEPTLYHEATHQLLYEIAQRDRPIAEREHFWIIEGIACYMESFRNKNGRLSIGDPRFVRFEAARYRYLVDAYYVPLARFETMGMQEFQSDANIQRNYSQASGLAHFFMQYQGGRYRDALIEHLSQLYSADSRQRTRVASLAELAGVGYAELDRQYGEYLKNMEAAVSRASALSN